jgi:hypothetical protein
MCAYGPARCAALALGERRRKAGQSGRAVRANPDAPLAAPHRAELHKPTQGLIRSGNGGFVSSPGRFHAVGGGGGGGGGDERLARLDVARH